MSRYQHGDVSFEVPNDWLDRTISAFAAPMKPGQKIAANVVLTRDAAAGNESLAAYADRQMVELAKRLDGFQLLQRQEIRLAGQPAIELSFTWHNESSLLQQRVIFVMVQKQTVLNITATAARTDFGALEPKFQSILNSLQFPDRRY